MMDYKFRDGIQAIVYRNVGDKREFLIMHRIKNWAGWEFPKGGIKKNETHKQTLMRELMEECGIREVDVKEVWPTDTNIRINYPQESWDKTGYRGALYKNFLVELDKSVKLTIENNDELEHDAIKWITEDKVGKYLDPKLQKAINESNKALKSYLVVREYAENVKKKVGRRFVSFLLYGSRTRGQNRDDSDFDMILVLTKVEKGDLERINKCKLNGLEYDLQLVYLDEMPQMANFLSWDSTSAYYYFILKNAIPLLGSNPWELIKAPDNNILEISILAKTQYYIYRIRQLLLGQSKNNTNLLYFTKRLTMVMRMLMLLKEKEYTDVNDTMERFHTTFPDSLSELEIEALKSAVKTNTPLEARYLYSLYMKVYHSCLDYMRQNSSLVTLNDISTDRKV